MTLYEINQQGYKGLSNMIESDIDKAIDDLAIKIADSEGKYFMLLCNELKYYTLFTWKSSKVFVPFYMANEVVAEARKLGNLKAIEVSDDCTEFWIENNDECHAYIFFNYDRGVIEV